MSYLFINDPSHGWLRVPKQELIELGIEDKISRYSYMRNNFAYLEEDSDLSIYLKAKFPKPEDDLLKTKFLTNVPDKYGDNPSSIRDYDCYVSQ